MGLGLGLGLVRLELGGFGSVGVCGRTQIFDNESIYIICFHTIAMTTCLVFVSEFS